MEISLSNFKFFLSQLLQWPKIFISSIICKFIYIANEIDRSDYIKNIIHPSSYNKTEDREDLIKSIGALISKHIDNTTPSNTDDQSELNVKDNSVDTSAIEKPNLTNNYDGSQRKKPIPDIFLTENGRTAIYLFLKSLDIKSNSKIAVQPFTCNSSVAPIFWAGHQPVYIDITEESLSMDPALLEAEAKKGDLTGVILQHTFGIPAEIERIVEICKKYTLFLLEDCAHTLDIGTETSKGRNDSFRIGLSGDASIISFGLEKTLPTKVGGALLLNNKSYNDSITKYYETWDFVSRKRSFLWLINPFIRSFARKTGRFGSELIELLRKMEYFEVGFRDIELKAGMPRVYPRKLTGNLAWVANRYLLVIDDILNEKREQGVKYTDSINNLHEGFIKGIYRYPSKGGCLQLNNPNDEYTTKDKDDNKSKVTYTVPHLKYPIILKNNIDRDKIVNMLQSKGFYITDWYCKVLYPPTTDLESYNYNPGSCPVSEKVSSQIINLPTGTIFDLEMLSEVKVVTTAISD